MTLPPDSVIRGAASIPAFDPLAITEALPSVPFGARVTVLLGKAGGALSGRRVVQGRLSGAALRGTGQIDIQLTEVVTWFVQHPPEGLEVLPPATVVLLQVGVEGSVAETMAVLLGRDPGVRGRLAAAEVRFKGCWTCGGAAVSPEAVCCGSCGRRLRVGADWGRAVWRLPVDLAQVCAACWSRARGTGPHCAACGVAQTTLDRAPTLAGGSCKALVVRDRRRLGVIHGRLLEVAVQRLFVGGRAVVVATVGDVVYDRAPTGGPLPTAFTASLAFPVGEASLEAVLDRLADGELLRASERLLPCSTCVRAYPKRTAGMVRGLYCPSCGARSRLFADPRVATRHTQSTIQAPIRAHVCGALVRVETDRYCGACGGEVRDLASAGMSRYARL